MSRNAARCTGTSFPPSRPLALSPKAIIVVLPVPGYLFFSFFLLPSFAFLFSLRFFFATKSAVRGDGIKSLFKSFFSRYEILNCHCLSTEVERQRPAGRGGVLQREQEQREEKRNTGCALTSAATCQERERARTLMHILLRVS